jgi:hypothetical protein
MFDPSSGFYSQRMHALLLTVGVHEAARNISRETCLPLIVALLSLLLTPPLFLLPAVYLKKTMNSFKETALFSISNGYF